MFSDKETLVHVVDANQSLTCFTTFVPTMNEKHFVLRVAAVVSTRLNATALVDIESGINGDYSCAELFCISFVKYMF